MHLSVQNVKAKSYKVLKKDEPNAQSSRRTKASEQPVRKVKTSSRLSANLRHKESEFWTF